MSRCIACCEDLRDEPRSAMRDASICRKCSDGAQYACCATLLAVVAIFGLTMGLALWLDV